VLEDNGASVLKAFTGDECLAIAAEKQPDLITLDISMPGKTGAEVYSELRKTAATRRIPVCIITGQPELRKLIYERETPTPDGYLDKPIDEEALMRNIRKVLKLMPADHDMPAPEVKTRDN
jgi:CheY-like chemotaxis protein